MRRKRHYHNMMYWCPSHINRSTWILVKRTMCCNHLKSRVSFVVHAMRLTVFRPMDKENYYIVVPFSWAKKNLYICAYISIWIYLYKLRCAIRWFVRPQKPQHAPIHTKNAPHQNNNNTERINGVMQMQWKFHAAWNHVIS